MEEANKIPHDTEHEAEEVSEAIIYEKEVTSLLVSKTSNNLIINKVSNEFKIKELAKANKQAEEKSATLLKKIDEKLKLSAELDRKIEASAQEQSQILARKQRTGDIMKVLKEQIELMKNYAVSTKDQVTNLGQEIKTYSKHKHELDDNKNKIADLETAIKKALNEKDGNAVEVDPQLLMKNKQLKQVLAEKRRNLEEMELKFDNFKKLKCDHNKLLKDLCEKQEEHIVLNKTLSEKKEKLQSLKDERDRTVAGLEESNLQLSLKKDELVTDIDKVHKSAIEKKLKIENLEKSNLALETRHEQMKLKIEETETELKNKVELEKKSLIDVNEKFESLSKELVELKSVFQEKCQLKMETEASMIKMLETKNICAKQEIEVVRVQHKLDMITDQVNTYKTNMEALVIEKSHLEKEIIQMQEFVDNAPEILCKKLEGINVDFNENKDKLVKQGEFLKASMELLEVKLANMQRDMEPLDHQEKELESEIKLDNIKLDSLQKSVKLWTDRVNKEQADYNAALEKYNKEAGEAEKTRKDYPELLPPFDIEKNHVEDNFQASPKSHVPSVPHDTSLKRPGSPLFDINDELFDDANSQSGRKSPGILKDPRSPKRPVIPSKSVRFEGLSSNESNSTSLVEMEVDTFQQKTQSKSFCEESDSESGFDNIPRFRPHSKMSFKKRTFD